MKKSNEFTYSEMKKLLNKMVDMRSLLTSHGYNVPQSGSMLCPFHDNYDSPAAKYYADTNTIHCFAEHKTYSPIDAMQLVGLNYKNIFMSLWDSYSTARKEELLDNLDNIYETKVLFKESLALFKNGVMSYQDLCADIVSKVNQHTSVLQLLYNISREISEVHIDSDDYSYLCCLANLNNIKQITSGEIVKYSTQMRGYKYIINFIQQHEDAVLVFNMWKNIPIGCTIRSKNTHAFIDVGNTGGMFYGLCSMNRNFKYGDPIVLVEGPKDCEMFRRVFNYKNCLAMMTSNVSLAQLEVLKSLTNEIILCNDNDEAGLNSQKEFIRSNKKYFKITPISHPDDIKDFGDLITIARTDNDRLKELIARYRVQLNNSL